MFHQPPQFLNQTSHSSTSSHISVPTDTDTDISPCADNQYYQHSATSLYRHRRSRCRPPAIVLAVGLRRCRRSDETSDHNKTCAPHHREAARFDVLTVSQLGPLSGIYEPRGRIPSSRQPPPPPIAGSPSLQTSSDSRSGTPSLRRVRRFDQRQDTELRSASVDAIAHRRASVRFADDSAFETPSSGRRRTASTSDASAPHCAVRISQKTASAILYTLEEALRHPYRFTPDIGEENASMSDQTRGVAGTAASSNRPYGTERTSSGQATASPSDASRIRTPRQILNARQARQRGEEEASRRDQEAAVLAEQETQLKIDIERRKSAERRAAATAQQRDSGYRTGGGSTVGGRTSATQPYSTPTAAGPGDPANTSQYMRTQYGSDPAQDPQPTAYRPAGASARSRGATATQQPASQPQEYTSTTNYAQQPQSSTRGAQGQSMPSFQQQHPQQPSTQQNLPSRTGASNFPHAFERWEELSAKWEGVTSSFIRRLESYVSEAGNLPPEQAVMGRQISDLSAAGANLFHAVVELQRLRASSERKFQRWFFETRSQQEAYAEEIARLEQEHANVRGDLDNVRGERDSAHAEMSNLRTRGFDPSSEKRMYEMRRELAISKDEAKRAWEELGRREELELAQQQDLRNGKAVFVGGVQVFPSSVVSRGASLRQPVGREIYTTQPGSNTQQPYEYQEPSPTDTDPFTERRQPTQPGYVNTGQPTLPPVMTQPQQQQTPTNRGGDSRFYTQPDTFLHEQSLNVPQPTRSVGSESEEEPGPEIDEYGNVRRDVQGRPIPFRAPQATSFAPGPATIAPTSSDGGGGNIPATSSAMPPPSIPPSALRQQREQDPPEVISSPDSSEPEDDDEYNRHQARREAARTQAQTQGGIVSPADYEGEGFGSGQGWEEMGRHHHPTRLSDVMEEDDERSRTSRSSPQRNH